MIVPVRCDRCRQTAEEAGTEIYEGLCGNCERERTGECNVCPPLGWGVALCAHFGHMILRLLDEALLPEVLTDPDFGVRYIVETNDGCDIVELFSGDDEDAALEAFQLAEELLIVHEGVAS